MDAIPTSMVTATAPASTTSPPFYQTPSARTQLKSMTEETSNPSHISSSRTSPPANVLKALPNLPQGHVMQASSGHRPLSEAPTVSSFYSQPSPDLTASIPYQSEPIERRDVSPPNTSDIADHYRSTGRSSPDISPISATPSPTTSTGPALTSTGSKRYQSNLPLPRSTTKKFWKLPSSSKGSEDPESSNVRWDEYSGEPTAGDRGKPPSATPGSVKLRETSSPLRLRPAFGTSTTITSNNVPPRKRVGNRDVADAPIIIRPEWKGAGGRHSIVKPLFDKPLSPQESRQLPPGTQKRWIDGAERESDMQALSQADEDRSHHEAAEEAAAETHRASERASQEQKEREREQQQRMARIRIDKAKREREKIIHAQEESERRAKERIERVPVPSKPEPLRISTKQDPYSDARASSGLHSPPHLETESPGTGSQPSTPTNSNPKTPEPTLLNLYNPKLRLNKASSDMTSSSPPGSSSMKETSEQIPRDTLRSHDPHHQGPSSYAIRHSEAHDLDQDHIGYTSNDYHHLDESNSRPSPEHQDSPVNQQLRSRFSATTIATTAYDTSPPQTPELHSDALIETPRSSSILDRKRPVAPAGVIRRKPAPSLHGTPNSMPKDDAKRLPKLPPEADATNPIETLQAKVDVLRRRRRNLESVIEELSNVVQPSSITYDRKSRGEIKNTLISLEKELSDVVKDEHDTGLRLLRAWKRHDDFAAYEPTMIWVRRVTH